MRAKISLLTLFGISYALCGAQQTIRVTPESLADWTLTGAARQAVAAQPNLALPAGAQLARSFATGDLALTIRTRPQFGASAGDWPVLEIGSAALVFVRSGGTGKLALIVGAQAPVELPPSFSLDESGRSVETLAVNFARQGDRVRVEADGQSWAFAAAALSEPSLEVVASAGAGHAWDFAQLEVVLPALAVAADAAAGASGAGAAAGDATARLPGNRPVPSPGGTLGRFASGAGPNPGGTHVAAAASHGGGLEIFTPPAVRPGRAEAARAAVAGTKQK